MQSLLALFNHAYHVFSRWVRYRARLKKLQQCFDHTVWRRPLVRWLQTHTTWPCTSQQRLAGVNYSYPNYSTLHCHTRLEFALTFTYLTVDTNQTASMTSLALVIVSINYLHIRYLQNINQSSYSAHSFIQLITLWSLSSCVYKPRRIPAQPCKPFYNPIHFINRVLQIGNHCTNTTYVSPLQSPWWMP